MYLCIFFASSSFFISFYSWLKQHHTYEQLNLAAHATARTNSDNYVLAAALTFDKLPILVHSLLSVEVWREHVYPCLLPYLANHGNTTIIMRTFFILHNECVLSNLLECLLYHDYAAEALGDSLLDLIDYCSRRVTTLIQLSQQYSSTGNHRTIGNEIDSMSMDAKTAAALFEQDATDPVGATNRQLLVWVKQTLFRTGIASLTILRYIADYCTKLPLSMMTRLLDSHDIPLLMVPLIENPPWVRRITKRVAVTDNSNKSNDNATTETVQEPVTKEVTVWQKYDEHQWKDVEPANLLKLTQIEGQPWLTVHALLLEPECRRRYQLSSHRKNQLGRLRKYLNEVLVDQLPILVDLQRYIDETTISGNAPDAGVDGNMGSLLLETVPLVREAIIKQALQRIRESSTTDLMEGSSSISSSSKSHNVSDTVVSSGTEKEESIKIETKAEIRKAGKKIMIIEETEEEEENTVKDTVPSTVTPAIEVLEVEENTNPSIDLTHLKKKEPTGKRVSSNSSSIITKAKDQSLREKGSTSENAWKWEEIANYISRHAMRIRTRKGNSSHRAPMSSADTWPDSEDDKDLRSLGALYTADSFDEMALGAPQCAKCGQPAEKRCSRCQNEWYCSRQCQVAAWKGHKTVCDIVTEANK